MTKKSTPSEDTLICPECKQAGITVTFKDKRGQGSHRWAKHGVKGVSASTLAYHQRRDLKTALVPTSTEPIRTAPRTAEISLAIRGYAMGKLEALAEQIARENNLPEKEFVKQVAANLAELTQQ